MAFDQEISRQHRTCFLFLVDQSESMRDAFGGTGGGSKAQALSDVLNKTLRALALRTAKGNEIRDYYDIGVIGYGEGRAAPVLGGSLKGRNFVSVTDFMPNPLRVEERTEGEGQTIKFPIWVEPAARGDTPMVRALKLTGEVLNEWLATGNNRDSYPPTVINITDGEATDGTPQDLINAAEELKAIATSDGNVLLWNCHISGAGGASVFLPSSSEGLADNYARLLFDTSSVMPPKMVAAARGEVSPPPEPNARGFAFNAGLAQLIKFLDIGTRGADKR
jgi:hypothetical protein